MPDYVTKIKGGRSLVGNENIKRGDRQVKGEKERPAGCRAAKQRERRRSGGNSGKDREPNWNKKGGMITGEGETSRVRRLGRRRLK